MLCNPEFTLAIRPVLNDTDLTVPVPPAFCDFPSDSLELSINESEILYRIAEIFEAPKFTRVS